jgi:hypothetical protein
VNDLYPFKVAHMDYCANQDWDICECLKDTFDRMAVELQTLRERLVDVECELARLRQRREKKA